MGLIDADKVNPSDVFVGISDFAADCRNAVVKLLAAQPSTPSMRRADVIVGSASITYLIIFADGTPATGGCQMIFAVTEGGVRIMREILFRGQTRRRGEKVNCSRRRS